MAAARLRRRRKADLRTGWGCASDLFPWVEVTIGAGSNGAAPPSPFTDDVDRRRLDLDGLLQRPARRRALLQVARRHLRDERQLPSGGQGRHRRQSHHARHRRRDLVQRRQRRCRQSRRTTRSIRPDPGTPPAGATNALSEIENPNPQPGTNNYYIQDGYGGGSGSPDRGRPNANYGGGSYVNCADTTQPGVGRKLNYLGALPHQVNPNCADRALLSGQQLQSRLFRRRHQRLHRHKPEQLRLHDSAVERAEHRRRAESTKSISWAYYGDQFNAYLNDKYDMSASDEYCNICNWAQYSTSIMTNPAQRAAHLKDTSESLHRDRRRERCRRCPTSSRAAWSTAIRRLRS